MTLIAVHNQPAAASPVVPGLKALPAQATDSASSNNSANITANDFLSLLVAEMKNQDPTAQTDPNAYVNQLVQVNSLQQLIQINQTLSDASNSTTGTTPTGKLSGTGAPVSSNLRSAAVGSDQLSPRPAAMTISPAPTPVVGHGNLAPAAEMPAARRMTTALSSRN